MDHALPAPVAPAFGRKIARLTPWQRLEAAFIDVDLVPDLGARVGSREWFRGLVTCTILCASAIYMSPGFAPLNAVSPPAMPEAQWDEARAQAISPLALGGDTGRRMAATDAVVPLTDIPERPTMELVATLGQGDGFARVLTRAGVAEAEASRVAELVSGAVALGDIRPGTRMDVTLGRRANRSQARPLDLLAFRARFDLRLEVTRVNGALALTRIPIAVDHTPLRIQGVAGSSLYRSARAAGAPAKAVETYIKALAGKMSIGDVGANDRFDIIVEQARAETGEVETGDLLYAGLDRGKRQVRLMQWSVDGRTEWFEASGVGQKRGAMAQPVSSSRVTSGFGMRRHPLLGYSRFHKGMDFGSPYGAPIYAATDGIVAFAGRHGGHGNFVKLSHAGGIGTAYAHMSRIAVSAGARVRQGQVIGYVGSTGLSTGPHLHYELYKNGVAINPRSISFTTTSLLSGSDLANFKAKLNGLMSVRAGTPAPMAGRSGSPAGAVKASR
ncbi:M23 family metallopeptidase [Sphingobium boeckii]|uniref:Murein DD-endopeptidase MepM/ murein hydrolase activator NlpD n=1 Tax=Sphingobium boeckii TaxID=1082345 RepID=A0A7W9EDZ9_9SPHN|nr:M23 family metallopeptidase [Sphingobium boeckii]MBB5684156.1 murein DD-endopeptidase MepM/ murein hydrolase activator NlpD [Sphingobium boeckii]